MMSICDDNYCFQTELISLNLVTWINYVPLCLLDEQGYNVLPCGYIERQ